jgi:hypothetical protein
MISASNSRASAVLSGGILASFFLLAFLGGSPRALAHASQSSGARSAQQQSAQDPAKKDSANTASDSAASKTNAPKPHRIFTNDDLSPSSGIPIAPGARLRLKQLNRCDRTCFNDVKKQAISFGYITAFPRSTREEMDDRLANDIEELQNDPKWQRLLLEMISARLDSCSLRQKNSASPDNSPSHTPTRAEILEEEERMKNYRSPASSNVNAAGSAVLSYRFNTRPDPLKASLMVHQYIDELHQDCPVAQSTADSGGDEDP